MKDNHSKLAPKVNYLPCWSLEQVAIQLCQFAQMGASLFNVLYLVIIPFEMKVAESLRHSALKGFCI